MRLAISLEYCEPKSMTTIVSWWPESGGVGAEEVADGPLSEYANPTGSRPAAEDFLDSWKRVEDIAASGFRLTDAPHLGQEKYGAVRSHSVARQSCGCLQIPLSTCRLLWIAYVFQSSAKPFHFRLSLSTRGGLLFPIRRSRSVSARPSSRPRSARSSANVRAARSVSARSTSSAWVRR